MFELGSSGSSPFCPIFVLCISESVSSPTLDIDWGFVEKQDSQAATSINNGHSRLVMNESHAAQRSASTNLNSRVVTACLTCRHRMVRWDWRHTICPACKCGKYMWIYANQSPESSFHEIDYESYYRAGHASQHSGASNQIHTSRYQFPNLVTGWTPGGRATTSDIHFDQILPLNVNDTDLLEGVRLSKYVSGAEKSTDITIYFVRLTGIQCFRPPANSREGSTLLLREVRLLGWRNSRILSKLHRQQL